MNGETVWREIQPTMKSWRWMAWSLLQESELRKQRTNKRLQQTATRIRACHERLTFAPLPCNLTNGYPLTPAPTESTLCRSEMINSIFDLIEIIQPTETAHPQGDLPHPAVCEEKSLRQANAAYRWEEVYAKPIMNAKEILDLVPGRPHHDSPDLTIEAVNRLIGHATSCTNTPRR